jgi:hypothetical protein
MREEGRTAAPLTAETIRDAADCAMPGPIQFGTVCTADEVREICIAAGFRGIGIFDGLYRAMTEIYAFARAACRGRPAGEATSVRQSIAAALHAARSGRADGRT